MPRVTFTAHLRDLLPDYPRDVSGTTLREIVDNVIAADPLARSYLLDDQSALRKHVTVFIDRQPIHDRSGLTDPVPPSAEVFILQALSGG